MATRETTGSLVGIVGDFDPRNPTHHATNDGLVHAGLAFEWVPTEEVMPLGGVDAARCLRRALDRAREPVREHGRRACRDPLRPRARRASRRHLRRLPARDRRVRAQRPRDRGRRACRDQPRCPAARRHPARLLARRPGPAGADSRRHESGGALRRRGAHRGLPLQLRRRSHASIRRSSRLASS